MSDKSFGNLSFSSYTVGTEAERAILSLLAALKVHGCSESHPLMVKALKLKRSMAKSKVRRYTFDVVQQTPVAAEPSLPSPGAPTFIVEHVGAKLAEVLGLALRSKESRTASSGHEISKFVLGGELASCAFDLSTEAGKRRAQTACMPALSLIPGVSSVSIQPFHVRLSPKYVGLSVQCLYRYSL